jgi:hypothetical protein
MTTSTRPPLSGCTCTPPDNHPDGWNSDGTCDYHNLAAEHPDDHTIPWNCPTYWDGCNCHHLDDEPYILFHFDQAELDLLADFVRVSTSDPRSVLSAGDTFAVTISLDHLSADDSPLAAIVMFADIEEVREVPGEPDMVEICFEVAKWKVVGGYSIADRVVPIGDDDALVAPMKPKET